MVAGAEIEKLVYKITADVEDLRAGMRKAEGEVSKFSSHVGSETKKMAAHFAAAFTAAALIAGLKHAAQSAAEFEKAMAEVSTLLKDTSGVKGMGEEVKRLSKEFGNMPTQNAKALYQIISAGAKSSAEAIDTLTAANKLAVGGVTDLFSAADGLTSILNAYKKTGITAAEVSDAMFVGMRDGKTTIGELSTTLGAIAPIAVNAGISFDELVASIAAITKGGIRTDVAVMGLRATLASIIKPTKEAEILAKQMGIEFNATALKTKGLTGVLGEIREKFGDNIDMVAKLIPEIRALPGVLSLVGSAAEDFAATLENMKNKAGETDTAVGKLQETFAQKMARLKATVVVLMDEIGHAILDVVGPALTFLLRHFDRFVDAAKVLGAVIMSRVVVALVAKANAIRLNTVEIIRYQATLRAMAVLNGQAAAGSLTLASASATLRGAIVALGGPLNIAITLITAAAAAWAVYSARSEEATEKGIDRIKRLVAEYGKLPDAAEEIRKKARANIIAYDRQIVSLLRQKQALKSATSSAEELTAALSDPSAALTVKQIDQRVEELKKNIQETYRQLAELQRKQEAEKPTPSTARPPIVVEDPEVSEAKAKAKLERIKALASEELTVLDAQYQKGLLNAKEYADKMTAILVSGMEKEIAALDAEAARLKKLEPAKAIETEAKAFALRVQLREKLIGITLKEEGSEKELTQAIVDGRRQEADALRARALVELNDRYKEGKIAVAEYFAERRQLSRETTDAEIQNLWSLLQATNDLAEAQKIYNQILAARAKGKTEQLSVNIEERGATTDATRAAREINAEYLALRTQSAQGELAILASQHEEERAAQEAAFADQLTRIRTFQEERLALHGEYLTKEEAAEEIVRQQSLARDQLAAKQAQAILEAKIRGAAAVAGQAATMFGTLYEASGKKAKAFFIAEKASRVAETIMNTSAAVMKAWYQGGIFAAPMAALIAATGAAQVAVILSQKPPQYRHGGPVRHGSGLRDDALILAKRGEYVHPQETVRYYGLQAMEALRRRIFPRDAFAGFGGMAVSRPAYAFASGGQVSGGMSVSVPVTINGLPDPSLVSKLRGGIEEVVVKIIQEHSR